MDEHRCLGVFSAHPVHESRPAFQGRCSCGHHSRVVSTAKAARYLWWVHAEMTAATEAIADQLALRGIPDA